jgi:hypothetical protein
MSSDQFWPCDIETLLKWVLQPPPIASQETLDMIIDWSQKDYPFRVHSYAIRQALVDGEIG